MALYGCVKSPNGYLFSLDALVASGFIRSIKPVLKALPNTYRAFMLACIRYKWKVEESPRRYKDMAPADIFNSLGIPSELSHFAPIHSLLGTYKLLLVSDAQIPPAQLESHTYALYNGIYYILFCTQFRQAASNAAAEALSTLASALINNCVSDDLILSCGITWLQYRMALADGKDLYAI